jgi:hypothetical protein
VKKKTSLIVRIQDNNETGWTDKRNGKLRDKGKEVVKERTKRIKKLL